MLNFRLFKILSNCIYRMINLQKYFVSKFELLFLNKNERNERGGNLQR